MTKQDLASELNKMYHIAPKGDSTTMIRLFGIKYSDDLKNCTCSMSEIGVNYHAEISKGIRLAKYVKIK
jgi:hypothetical protein